MPRPSSTITKPMAVHCEIFAASKGIAIRSGNSTTDNQPLSRMARLLGLNFDREFIQEAQRANSENQRLFRKEAAQTADPDISDVIEFCAEMDAKHEAAANALSENVVASKTPITPSLATGDDMVVVPPRSDNSMPVIVPPRRDRR